MIRITYIVDGDSREAIFTNREDAELFWEVLEPLMGQGKVYRASMEDAKMVLSGVSWSEVAKLLGIPHAPYGADHAGFKKDAS